MNNYQDFPNLGPALLSSYRNWKNITDRNEDCWSWEETVDWYFDWTFIKWRSEFTEKKWKLWIDFMWSWFSTSKNISHIIWVRMVDHWIEWLQQFIKWYATYWIGYNEWDFVKWSSVAGNVYGWKLWKKLKEEVEKFETKPDFIVIRPRWWWDFIDLQYDYSSKESLDKIFASIWAKFILIEKLYNLLDEWWVMYVEIPMPLFYTKSFNWWEDTERDILDKIIENCFMWWIEIDNTWIVISAIRIEKNRYTNPIINLKKQALKTYNRYFGYLC